MFLYCHIGNIGFLIEGNPIQLTSLEQATNICNVMVNGLSFTIMNTCITLIIAVQAYLAASVNIALGLFRLGNNTVGLSSVLFLTSQKLFDISLPKK